MQDLLAENPWRILADANPQSGRFVLDGDLVGREPEFSRADIQLNLPPSPFEGSLKTCRVLVLNLNPGYSDSYAPIAIKNGWKHDVEMMHQRCFAEAWLANLGGTSPFLSLDPRWDQWTGYHWWPKRVRCLLKECGLAAVRAGLLCVEWFPYHSRSWTWRGDKLPSQDFSFRIVRRAIEMCLPIVVFRSKRCWFEAVPSLAGYEHAFDVKSHRNPTLNPHNLGDRAYEHVLTAIGNGTEPSRAIATQFTP